MTFDNEVASMTPGQALIDVPIPKLIENTAKAIASAQFELDASAVRAATLLSETRVAFLDENGESKERSLLELGFTPSFYHFSETEMEFKVEISVKVESGIDFSIGGEISNEGSGQAVTYGASMSLDLHHKYGFDMTACSTVKTTMKAVPAPQTFINAIKVHAASGGTIAAGEMPGLDAGAGGADSGDAGAPAAPADSGAAGDSGGDAGGDAGGAGDAGGSGG
jgi:hypothetical protein